MYIVGITGASGVIYGVRLIEELLKIEEKVGVIFTETGYSVLAHEMNLSPEDSIEKSLMQLISNYDQDRVKIFSNKDLFASAASGSSSFKGIIISPCSMKTLSAIASGYTDCLINRAADVALKERRPCIIVPRETPYNLIHIENMKKILLAGGQILPASPGFYNKPETIDDLVNFMTGKTLSLLKIKHSLYPEWNGC